MSNKPDERTRSTGIAWTDATWNPLRARNRETGDVGWVCVRVSDGCKNCYAATQNKVRRRNRGTGLDYTVPDLARVETFVDEKTLALPLGWRKPRRVFVCSMTDLFGEWVSDEEIDRVFAVMALTPQHTYQVLTKRPERMREYIGADEALRRMQIGLRMSGHVDYAVEDPLWPLPNVWLGVSVEDQAAADERIPLLLDTPAAVRFISAEPLLGTIDLDAVWSETWDCLHCGTVMHSRFIDDGPKGEPICQSCGSFDVQVRGLDWVIVGGESGTPYRDMEIEWAASIHRQCQAAGVPLFMKQDSGSKPGQQGRIPDNIWIREWPLP